MKKVEEHLKETHRETGKLSDKIGEHKKETHREARKLSKKMEEQKSILCKEIKESFASFKGFIVVIAVIITLIMGLLRFFV